MQKASSDNQKQATIKPIAIKKRNENYFGMSNGHKIDLSGANFSAA